MKLFSRLLPLVSFLVIVCAQDTNLRAVKATFDAANIPGDLAITFEPSVLLEVSLPQATGSPITLHAGIQLPRNATAGPPIFRVINAPSHGPFVVAAVDPDAPTPQTPTNAQIRHFLGGDFTAEAGGRGSVSRGLHLLVNSTKAVSEFRQPTPPAGSPAHRYIFLVFEQPAGFDAQTVVTSTTPVNLFNISSFAEQGTLNIHLEVPPIQWSIDNEPKRSDVDGGGIVGGCNPMVWEAMSYSYVLPWNTILATASYALTIGQYSTVAVYAVQVYEWLLNLSEEVELIHQAHWSSMKIAYMICRYVPLLTCPVYLWAWLRDHPPELCAKVVHPLYGFLTCYQLSAQGVMLIRTYAFTGRKLSVLLMLLACYLAVMGTEIWLFSSRFVFPEELYVAFGTSGCFANDAGAQSGSLFDPHRVAIQSGCVLLGIFLLDVIMTATIIVHCIRIRSTQGALGKAFLAQGLVAFLVMSAVNLPSAVLYLRGDRLYNGLGLPYLFLSDVMACRLILLLRRKVKPTETDLLDEQSRIVREALAVDESAESLRIDKERETSFSFSLSLWKNPKEKGLFDSWA
ncbi:hypothetical protein ONZ45_g10478 [Pleurotus djamor]|nr:hypothetical protein ONZ45_g10478 [Pleurotus djamor]